MCSAYTKQALMLKKILIAPKIKGRTSEPWQRRACVSSISLQWLESVKSTFNCVLKFWPPFFFIWCQMKGLLKMKEGRRYRSCNFLQFMSYFTKQADTSTWRFKDIDPRYNKFKSKITKRSARFLGNLPGALHIYLQLKWI